MKNDRRIKVDFPDVDLSKGDISADYIDAGKSIVDEGKLQNIEDFLKNLGEYNSLQYRLLDRTEQLCKSMEKMVDNDFIVVNDMGSLFEDIDRITERMDHMIYFVPRDEVLQVLEDYLSLHQRLFNKPMFFVESGWDNLPRYEC
jgi:hypothetical protein